MPEKNAWILLPRDLLGTVLGSYRRVGVLLREAQPWPEMATLKPAGHFRPLFWVQFLSNLPFSLGPQTCPTMLTLQAFLPTHSPLDLMP